MILAPGDVFLNADFGYQPDVHTGTIGDLVWFDANADGTRMAAKPGIAGVTVALTLDANNNGVVDAGEIIATDTTDANGQYLFTGLPAGKYLVAVTDSNNVLGTMTKTVGSSAGSEGNSQPIPYAIDLGRGRERPDRRLRLYRQRPDHR